MRVTSGCSRQSRGKVSLDVSLPLERATLEDPTAPVDEEVVADVAPAVADEVLTLDASDGLAALLEVPVEDQGADLARAPRSKPASKGGASASPEGVSKLGCLLEAFVTRCVGADRLREFSVRRVREGYYEAWNQFCKT